MKKPILDTEEALIINGVARKIPLREIAQELQRDVSVVSRKLQTLNHRLDILHKINNRWILKESGHRLLKVFQQYILDLDRSYSMANGITLGCSRAFASQVLIPHLHQLPGPHNTTVVSTEDGVEELLLNKKVDIGFDCGDPISEEIRFKRVCHEEMVLACSKEFYKKNIEIDLMIKYVHYSRLNFEYVQKSIGKSVKIEHTFNDLFSVKSALLNHLGCSIVPKYLIHNELKSNDLVLLSQVKTEKLVYSVFYRADSGFSAGTIQSYVKWLKSVSYML